MLFRKGVSDILSNNTNITNCGSVLGKGSFLTGPPCHLAFYLLLSQSTSLAECCLAPYLDIGFAVKCFFRKIKSVLEGFCSKNALVGLVIPLQTSLCIFKGQMACDYHLRVIYFMEDDVQSQHLSGNIIFTLKRLGNVGV